MLVLIFCHITFDLSLSFENDHNQYLQTEKKLKSEEFYKGRQLDLTYKPCNWAWQLTDLIQCNKLNFIKPSSC